MTGAGMSVTEVHRVLDALAAAGCRAWVGGGWGVDALVGSRTRPHRDLDLAVDATGEAAALGALQALGYAVETDWRPVRVELAAPGRRWVDLHPVRFDAAGDGTQAGPDGAVFPYPSSCFMSGSIDGRPVGCLSVDQQLAFHTGYEPRDVDLADLALLRRLQAGGADPRNGPSGSGLRPLAERDRLVLRETFTTDAQRYAAHRPTYPPALFDALAAYGHLPAGARVLEVAPGTGQATRSLAERGWSVTAVELGAQMAALARRAVADHPGTQVVTGAFEDWPLPAEPFDAVVCATAWHWLDPSTRLAKAVRALRPGGTVAVVWTHHVAGGTQDFFDGARDCYRRFDPETYDDAPMSAEGDLAPSTQELCGSPLVTDVQSHLFPVELTYTTEAYLDLLRTYSTTIRLPAGRRDGLLGCLGDLVDHRFGGRVTKRYAFELVLGRRRP